jgi:sec-independent protein translocase protein TatA
MFSSQDIILLGIIVIVLFGANRLPEIGRGLGKSIRDFKKGMSESEEIQAPKQKETEKEAKLKDNEHD